jgi:hypothetical protein
MSHDATCLREHAQHCRELARNARDQPTIKRLIDMAEDFEIEAEQIDRRERIDLARKPPNKDCADHEQ